MKRVAHLFEQIVDRDNMRLAFSRAVRGKRDRRDARRFSEHLEDNLRAVQQRLLCGDFCVGRFHQFVIHDPKGRIITAPCFEERVLHHAITNVCEPVFERWLIADTYACRVGKGRLPALDRAREFARSFGFFLKLDIRKYFDSIPHDELLQRLTRIFKDRRLMQLFDRIVRSFRGLLGRGVPIGSLTSQHLANFYLGWFDRFVKEQLRVKGYVRYMDDMALWGGSTCELSARLDACREFLDTELRLELKDAPYINRVRHGVDLLGCRVFPSHVTLNCRSRTRFRRKLAALEAAFQSGEIEELQLQQRAGSLVAFSTSGAVSSFQLRRRVLQGLAVSGHRLEPGEPGRELEQRRQELPVGEPQQERAVEPEQQPGLPRGRKLR
jgi:hypothetical protein